VPVEHSTPESPSYYDRVVGCAVLGTAAFASSDAICARKNRRQAINENKNGTTEGSAV
jgi:hypothetical protein